MVGTEEVKEMKSVDEETNKEDDDDSDNGRNNGGVKGFNELQDTNDIATPQKDHEQNEQSFRGQ